MSLAILVSGLAVADSNVKPVEVTGMYFCHNDVLDDLVFNIQAHYLFYGTYGAPGFHQETTGATLSIENKEFNQLSSKELKPSEFQVTDTRSEFTMTISTGASSLTLYCDRPVPGGGISVSN